jgi:DNA-binding IscR family transcriptional regulator
MIVKATSDWSSDVCSSDLDGPIILTTCFTSHGDCGLSPQCTVREPLRRVHEGILKLLDNITITDLSADEEPPGERQEPRPAPIALTVLAQ